MTSFQRSYKAHTENQACLGAACNPTQIHMKLYLLPVTGVQTLVGNTFATAAQGPAPLANAAIYSADGGDGNQENADNEAVLAWQQLQDPCFHFELNR